MLHAYPPFYREFHCTASACPDNCCVGWEVVVDDETAAYYASLSGPLGQALRKAMTVDADGDRILAMVDGHCPFWTQDHLCRVELELGHEAPCATCRKFPRITQDYGVFTEYGLTLACPEAARLILSQSGPWTISTQGTPGDPAQAEFDWQALLDLSPARQTMLDLLWRQDLTPREALGLCLLWGQRFQQVFDGETPAPFQEADALALLRGLQPGDPRPLLELHRSLEILTDQWRSLLEQALGCGLTAADFARLDALPQNNDPRNLGSYYLYRYWFRAVADYDCLLPLQRLAAAWSTVRCLEAAMLKERGSLTQADRLRLHQLYAKEVEHDDVNADALAEALWEDARFSLPSLLALV